MLFRICIVVGLILAGSGWANAQEEPTPTQDSVVPLQVPLQPPEQSVKAAQEPLRPAEQPVESVQVPAPVKRNTYLPAQDSYDVFVLGDSLAGGLYAGMERLTIGDKELKVGGRFKEDSGIARPEFYDWNDAIPKILESNKVDIAVILIGTNDAQPMTDGVERLEFGTPPWTALYSREIDRLINTLKQGGAAIYWVSLPPMQAPSYNASITEIAAIQKRQAEAASIKYVDVRPQLRAIIRVCPDSRTDQRGRDVPQRARSFPRTRRGHAAARRPVRNESAPARARSRDLERMAQIQFVQVRCRPAVSQRRVMHPTVAPRLPALGGISEIVPRLGCGGTAHPLQHRSAIRGRHASHTTAARAEGSHSQDR